MCGIVGYVGQRDAAPILLEGLRRLEYRGYDSAGLAVAARGRLRITKAAVRVAGLRELVGEPPPATSGIAHTRWATHGEPNDVNAHPHTDEAKTVALVHNGIIENFATLKAALIAEGHAFTTDTDTEVLAHLIEKYLKRGLKLERAVGAALRDVEGTYGIVVMCSSEPGVMVGAPNGSPMVLAIADGEYYLASDVAALVEHTRQVIYLDDGEMGVLTPDGFHTATIAHKPVEKEVHDVDWDLSQIEKGGYDHFMLKEIMEQPDAVRNATRGRLLLS